jgi:hypothetical protein
VHTVQAFDFIPLTGTTGYTAQALGGALSCLGAPCNFLAPVNLPAGALLTSIELHFCDTDVVNDVFVSLFKVVVPGGTQTELAGTQSGGNPGCAVVTGNLPAPETIDNRNRSYYVTVLSGPNTTTRFYGVRLFYTLQVSPAPAVASFSDVPTGHPFFRFVQALVAAGITSGCGGGRFCVDDPITRGQMAVFLSLGLGLHFAP